MGTIKTIAITGKGGTGKTMIATLLIKQLVENYKDKRVLAIDADSAMSLPYTLNIDVKKTVSQLRKELVGPAQGKRMKQDGSLKEWIGKIVTHADGFDLLVMGRPEEPGCFCAVNDLLKYSISTLVDDYDVVIIDGEAGPEQLNRRVLASIDELLGVSDMSARSLATAGGIVDVARTGDNGIRIGSADLLLNRVRDDKPDQAFLDKAGLQAIGWFPEDRLLNQYDRSGRSLLELPEESACVRSARELLRQLLEGNAG